MKELLEYDKFIDLVLSIDDNWITENTKFNNKIKLESLKLRFIQKYNDLRKEPIQLWMFVPCDDEGNYLVKPKPEDYVTIFNKSGLCSFYYNDLEIWERAKKRCYFEEFDYYRTITDGKWFVRNAFLKIWYHEFDYQKLGNFNYLYRYKITPTLFNKIFSYKSKNIMNNNEDKIIEDYLNPLLKDLMDKSLVAVKEIIESNSVDSDNFNFIKTFIEDDAFNYYTNINHTQNLVILSDLKHKLSKII